MVEGVRAAKGAGPERAEGETGLDLAPPGSDVFWLMRLKLNW